ncbi:MAG: insulinase family protein [Lachnospiraceae bacterium]|nr:insulinase family protein [Lachnospiraceae bacterium]
MDFGRLDTYEVLLDRPVSDLNSQGAILRHKKTGARIVLLSNDDDNKVFFIGFRTPPADSTGVAHIIEHSVLCGSAKYPVKDPFVELAKGSLNTFLNAMTYPDKTVYPVASCNKKDFANLMDVYLDAVFHPRIYDEKKIFEQEGWHYETDDDGKLIFNGVVYNEMKGAYSSADDVLERQIMNEIYLDNAYGVDSGGRPENIPDLTYEAFIDFHKRYYHPSNSYIYLYGDMDMIERLEYLDREYLSHYERLDIDSTIKRQPVFEGRKEVESAYPILKDDDRENNYYYSYSVMVDKSLDPEFYIAMDVLDYALCSAPGSPVKEALTKAGIGEDNYTSCDGGLLQPFFSFISKNAKEGEKDRFVQVIEDTLKEQAQNGIDKDFINAALNLFEFKYKEADFGSYPKGLMYGLHSLDSWLYDDMQPFLYIEANETYKKLRQKAEEGYFEQLIKEIFLDNPSKVIMSLKPSKTMTDDAQKAVDERLRSFEGSLSQKELEDIKEHAGELKAYQASEDTPEALATLPMLTRDEIEKKAQGFKNDELKVITGDGVQAGLLWHDYFTNKVSYIRVLFEITDFSDDMIFDLGLMKSVIGLVNTKNYSYGKLNSMINLTTGGISPVISVVSGIRDSSKVRAFFEMKVRCFEEKTAEAISLIKEMLLESDFSDTDRLLELFLEQKAGMQASLQSAGHQTALTRALSAVSKAGWISDRLSGLTFCDNLAKLCDDYDSEKAGISQRLKTVLDKVVNTAVVSYDFTGSSQGRELLEKQIANLPFGIKDSIAKEAAPALGAGFSKYSLKEALVNSSDVVYVCMAGDYKRAGLKYTGALKVLKVMMGYDYLWLNIRVLGGAYGCMSGFTRAGFAYFTSYRDPNLEKTIDVYKGSADYIESSQLTEDELTKYIIGAIATQDMPLTPQQAGQRSWNALISELTEEDEQRERDEITGCSIDDIHALAAYIRAFLEDGVLTVNGKEGTIKEAGALFDKIRPMF